MFNTRTKTEWPRRRRICKIKREEEEEEEEERSENGQNL